MSDNIDTEVVENVEPFTLEETIRQLRSQLTDVTTKNNELYQRAVRTEQALNLSQVRGQQLEANLKALRTQRDLFIEREADSLVDVEMLQAQKNKDEAQHNSDLEAKDKEVQPLRAKLQQAVTALDEVRNKFGEAKHEQKELLRYIEGQDEYKVSLQEDLEQYKEALNWYINATAGVRFSIPNRFFKIVGEELNAKHILIAYRSTSDVSETGTMPSKTNIDSFIIRAVRKHFKK